jgi:hypothetical protein
MHCAQPVHLSLFTKTAPVLELIDKAFAGQASTHG